MDELVHGQNKQDTVSSDEYIDSFIQAYTYTYQSSAHPVETLQCCPPTSGSISDIQYEIYFNAILLTRTPVMHFQQYTICVVSDTQKQAAYLKIRGYHDLRVGSWIYITAGRVVACNGRLFLKTNNPIYQLSYPQISGTFFRIEDFQRKGIVLYYQKQYQDALQTLKLTFKEMQTQQIAQNIVHCYIKLEKFQDGMEFLNILLDIFQDREMIQVYTNQFAAKLNQPTGVKHTHCKQTKIEEMSKKLNCSQIAWGRRERLKELVLTEWPRLLNEEQLRYRLNQIGIPIKTCSVKGKTCILSYRTIEEREVARKLLGRSEEFMLANEPVI